MIPKTIHYCWFGDTPKNDEILDCIESWKRLCPDFSIVEWNELNFPVEEFPFASKMYSEKRWAFVSDYARLYILYEHGGFYLDTDMLLLQSLSQIAEKNTNTCVLGEESKGIISAGMIGTTPHHPFIERCKNFYDKNERALVTIPRVLSQTFKEYPDKNSLTIYPPKAFYPFDAEHIKEFHVQNLGSDVIGVHLWHYSWGSPLSKFLKKIGIYQIYKKLLRSYKRDAI